ncbi:hypothetical protein Tco_0578080 [Tanacetum coccineum]
MDDPNITMEEYIRLEEEKSRRHSRTFNWKTATFRKIENYEDENDYNFLVNELKKRSENDNNRYPSPPNPTIDYIDDLDFFKEFENEFPAIVYNDARTSKSDYLTKPILNHQYIDEFNLNDETSLSEYDEENVSRFNDLFNIIHPDDSKSEKENDDNDIDIEQSLEGNKITHGSNGLSETNMAPLPAVDQRHPWLRYQIEEYNEGIRHSYEQRLENDNRSLTSLTVSCIRFEGLTPEIRGLFKYRANLCLRFYPEVLSTFRIVEIRDGVDVADTLCFQLGGVRRRMTWRQFILALGLHTEQEMAKDGFGAYWDGSYRLILDKEDLRDYWIEISFDRDFLGPAPSYVLIRDPVRRLCHRMIAYGE